MTSHDLIKNEHAGGGVKDHCFYVTLPHLFCGFKDEQAVVVDVIRHDFDPLSSIPISEPEEELSSNSLDIGLLW